MRIRTLTLALAFMLAATITHAASIAPFTPADAPPAPDYAKKSSWLTLPDNPGEHPVDVFWVYPTILADDTHWLMDTANADMIKAAQNTIVRQASVFEGQANIYAPLYRQMNMAALGLDAAQQTRLINYGIADVWQAFNYYLTHHNKGRPFILAGHSQGSNIMVNLAVKHWGSLGVEERLVAAYLIGWSITQADLEANPHLAMCETATQTNCLIAYNTVAAGRQKAAPTILKGSVVVNPLNWTTGNKFAPANLNLGARFMQPDGSTTVIPNFTSAQVIDFGLVVDPADPTLVDIDSATFPKGVYHPFDYSLFYENIRQNVRERIKASRKQ